MAKITFIGAGSLGFTRGLVRDVLGPRVIAAHEQTTPQVLARGQTVYPGHRMLEALIGFGADLEKLVDVAEADLLFGDERPGDAPHADLRPQDQASQASNT